MDMNYYLHREQVERVRADQAGHRAAADAHREMADRYREKIDQYRQDNLIPPQPQV